MRKHGEIVGAVDFGSRAIRVLIGRKDADGTMQVIGHGTAPGGGCVSHGVIQDLNAARLALKQARADAEREARVRVHSLFCGINGRNVETFIREGNVNLDIDVVEQSHMDEALDIASRDVLGPGKRVVSSITAQEWYVDDLRVIDPVGIRGHVLKTRVHFARIPSVIEDNIIQCIESQRCELEDIIFLPIAAALGCLTPEDMELGVALLDMGRSTTGLAVYRDHRILGTNSFEWGGYHVTRDVAAGLQVSFEEADELILDYGISLDMIARADDSSELPESYQATRSRERATNEIKLKTTVQGAPNVVPREELDEIVFERAHELLTKVRQHVHSRGLAQHLVRGVVITGGAASIKNMAKLAEAVFQVPCREAVASSISILPHGVDTSEYSAAVGVVRHGFDYRLAARNGRSRTTGPIAARVKKMGRVLQRYFF